MKANAWLLRPYLPVKALELEGYTPGDLIAARRLVGPVLGTYEVFRHVIRHPFRPGESCHLFTMRELKTINNLNVIATEMMQRGRDTRILTDHGQMLVYGCALWFDQTFPTDNRG